VLDACARRAGVVDGREGRASDLAQSPIPEPYPDLQANVLPMGYDFVDNDTDPEDPLVSGASLHGSHVAGIVAAVTDNGTGVAGGGWNTKILPIRVLGASDGTSFAVAQWILYAAGLPTSSGRVPPQPARVINLSLGSASSSSTIHEAIRRAREAGAVVVAAVGNEALRGNPLSYPAAYEEVIAVGAVGPSGQRAPYSQFHPYVDIAAPGGDQSVRRTDGILSTDSVERGGSWYFDYEY
jgi:serine protease